jgi:GNAT superfamily N-acetyltransferase
MEQIAGRAADFSARTGHPLHWPVFPGAPDRLGRILMGLGLKREDDHIAMRAFLGDPIPAPAGAPKISGPLRDENAVRRWAEYAWRGFDSGEMPPEPFVTFALNMARRPEISLVCAPGAAGMLCAAEGSAGIYYVATVPEYRGRGLGGAVVEALKAAARGMGFGTVTLLATPRGHPLYLRHGFRDTGAVQIYS